MLANGCSQSPNPIPVIRHGSISLCSLANVWHLKLLVFWFCSNLNAWVPKLKFCSSLCFNSTWQNMFNLWQASKSAWGIERRLQSSTIAVNSQCLELLNLPTLQRSWDVQMDIRCWCSITDTYFKWKVPRMEVIIVHSLHPYSKHEVFRHGFRLVSRFPFMEKETHWDGHEALGSFIPIIQETTSTILFLLRLLSLCLNLFGTFQQGIVHPDLKMTLKTSKHPQNSPLLPLSSLQN